MKILLPLLLLPFQLLAQDLTGIWTGTIQTTGNNLRYELVVSESKAKLSGYALTVFTFNGVENMGVKEIKLKKKNGEVMLEDGELVYNNYTTPPKRSKLFSTLTLQVKDSTMTLTGTFITKSLDFRDNTSYTGTIQLQKQNKYTQTKLIAKLEELNLSNALSFIPPKDIKKEEPAIAAVTKEDIPLPPLKQREQKIIPATAKAAIKRMPLALLHPKANDLMILPPEVAIAETLPPSEPKETQVTATFKSIGARMIVVPSRQAQKNIVKLEQKPVVKEATPPVPMPAIAKTTDVKTTEAIVPGAAAALTKRKTEVIQNIFFKTDSLVLSLYDNGTIDGDTVSVVLNGKVIIAKKGLTANAIRTTVYVTPDLGDSLQLIMYAENLGSIPPNTGLLIIQDGDQRNEIRFAGDMQKSSAVILRRRR